MSNPPPTPSFSVTFNHHPTALSIVLFLWLNGWLCHIWCAILLNDIMDLPMLSLDSLRTLVLLYLDPKGPWCVFVLCSKASSRFTCILWGGYTFLMSVSMHTCIAQLSCTWKPADAAFRISVYFYNRSAKMSCIFV